MTVRTRGGRRSLEPKDVRSSDEDFTRLLERVPLRPLSSAPPPPRSEARPRVEPAPPPPSRPAAPPPPPAPPQRSPEPARAETSAVVARPIAERPLYPRISERARAAAKLRRRRTIVATTALGLLAFGATVGALVESVVSPRAAMTAGDPVAAPPPPPPPLCVPPEAPPPAPSVVAEPPPPAATHHAHHRADPARASPSSAPPRAPDDTQATPDDYAAAADALEKAKQETTLP